MERLTQGRMNLLQKRLSREIQPNDMQNFGTYLTVSTIKKYLLMLLSKIITIHSEIHTKVRHRRNRHSTKIAVSSCH
jgi:hypothetical protein